MASMKAIGSEKLPLDQKLKRIMEIANYGVTEPKNSTHKTATLEYSITAPDGCNYGIIRENSEYKILKEGENGYTYVDGMLNNRKYNFPSYSKALKKLNLLMKPLNERYNGGTQLNLIGEQEEDKKYVLKTPEVEPEPAPEVDLGMDIGMEDEGGEEVDLGMDLGMEDEGGEEVISGEVEVTGEEGESKKSVQKLTGKLGQKLRDLPEVEMDADLIKYVLNSVISAVDLEKLSPDDVEEITEKFEDDEIDYTEEGEFDVDLDGEEEMDLDFAEEGGEEGGEEMDLEAELAEEELNEFLPAARAAFGATLGNYAGKKVSEKASSMFQNESELGEQVEATIDIPNIGEYVNDGENEEAEEGYMDDAVAEIGNIFGINESKVDKSLSKYFKYTTQEIKKQKLREKKEQSLIKEKKNNLLSEAINTAKYNKKIKNSFSTYEQERAVKKFLKENSNSRFVGKSKRGDVVFKVDNALVEITRQGKKL